MRSRTVSTAAALAFMTALSFTLTACGGGDDGPSKIKGADEGKPSASPSEKHSSKAQSGERPEIKLPEDVKYRFDWEETGGKAEEAVLSDTEQFIKAVDLAIVHQDPLDKAFLFYTEGNAAANGQEWIQGFVDQKDSVTGIRRFYDDVVHVKDDGTASIAYCEDESKAYNKNLDTGKVKKTPVTEDSYIAYQGTLKKNSQGVWITMKLISRRGASQCQP